MENKVDQRDLMAIFADVKKIAGLSPFGFSIDKNLQQLSSGYVVASSVTQNSFDDAGLKNVLAVVFRQDTEEFDGIGGWFNSDDGMYYYDAIKVFQDKDQALEYGKNNGQMAIFDLNTFTEIKL